MNRLAHAFGRAILFLLTSPERANEWMREHFADSGEIEEDW
jgi:hypothetical protein